MKEAAGGIGLILVTVGAFVTVVVSSACKPIWVAVLWGSILTGYYFAVSWMWAYDVEEVGERRRRQKRVARRSLLFPLWPLLLVSEGLLWLLARAFPRDRGETAVRLCPECRRKLERGIFR